MNNNILFILATALLFKRNQNTNKVNVAFNIRNENNKVINGAIISITPYNSRSTKNIVTACNGTAILRNICKNIYKIIIYKNGYKPKTVIINANKNINCNICLCSYKKNRLYGIITNEYNQVVNRAIVVLYKVIGKGLYFPVKFTYTDFTGEYNFFDIPKGRYIIKAQK